MAIVGVLCGSCNTPTLPIPPPIIEALEAPDALGMVEARLVHRHDQEDAVYLLVFNQNTGIWAGAPRVTDPDYAFRVRIAASIGNCLVAYFMIAPGEVSDRSDAVCVPPP
ncbi:MAG: hypothetical protein HY907_18540 [Deltaproteobacteria bacterium]|nr:hypothetical protein [Deltaproteobacteria bacterium]